MSDIRDNKDTFSSASIQAPDRDKRSGKDRRARKVPMFKYLILAGGRHKARRTADSQKYFYFDRYSSKLFAAIVFILFLSIFDALLTLYLIEKGSSEINPAMAYFLKFGPLTFMGAKYFLTSLGVVVLLIFKNVFISRAKIYTGTLFSYVILAFSTVIAWELYLIFFIVS